MTDLSLAAFVETVLEHVAHDVPRGYAEIAARLGAREVLLEVDGERSSVVGNGLWLWTETDVRSPEAHIRLDRPTLRKLLEGKIALVDALRSDAVFLAGSVETLIDLDGAIAACFSAAVRCVELEPLARDYLTGTPASRARVAAAREEAADLEPQAVQCPTRIAMRPADAVPEAPNCVTIFGGGIAGLTAAHELVERGFCVQVWEPADNQRHFRRGCEVGGMARTQWSRVHWPDRRRMDAESSFDADPPDVVEPRAEGKQPKPAPVHGKQTQPITPIDQKFYLKEEGARPNKRVLLIGALGDDGLYTKDLKPVVEQVVKNLQDNPETRHVYVEISYRVKEGDTLEEFISDANTVLDQFRKLARDTKLVIPPDIKFEAPSQRLYFDAELDSPPRERDTKRIRFELIVLDELPTKVPRETAVVIGFRVRERWLPGEHGYRFFPTFYRHVFDTMKRIPLLEAVAKSPFAQGQERAVSVSMPEEYRYTESGRTVYDNLRPLTSQVLAFVGTRRPTKLSRERIQSLEELREYTNILFGPREEGGMGLDPRDSVRVFLRIAQFLTSGESRRRELERISWWDYVQGARLGEAAQHVISHWPRALVAMDAKAVDARSHGLATVQFLLDFFRPIGFRDGTLRGPTNEAWLNPWRRYLEAQGVEFIHGKIKRFVKAKIEGGLGGTSEYRIWPEVKCYEPRYALTHPDLRPRHEPRGLLPPQIAGQPEIMPGYFILAVPPLEASVLAKSYLQAAGDGCGAPDSDLARMAAWARGSKRKDIQDPRRTVPHFRHFVGIQYYFAEDVFWVDGHVYYPDSPWSLTSVSQARFWDERTDWEHGYRGVLSVIIGDWHVPGASGKPASECNLDELAAEVWEQIKSSVQKDPKLRPLSRHGDRVAERAVGGRLPDPIYWHIDDNFTYDSRKSALKNGTPFPITPPGSWEHRPGSIEGTYDVEHGIVLAGAHLKTSTRLPTMEAANESGRRAVNAILEHRAHAAVRTAAGRRKAGGEQADAGNNPVRSRFRTLCELWNPEDDEVDDLRWWKELDEKLYARGLPHLYDVLGFDSLVENALRGGPDDPFDPAVVLQRVRRVLERMGKARNDARSRGADRD